MSLNQKQINITREELQENFNNLTLSREQILQDLQFSEHDLEAVLNLDESRPGEVWKLRDYLEEKLKLLNLPYRPFSILKPGANKWFSYQKTWK
jgi:hypothetical protein